MLVRLPEGVLAATHKKLTPSNAALCTFNFTLAFVLRYHLLSAAGVAGEGEGAELRVARNQPGADERLDECDEAARVASGVRYALSLRNALAATGKFGKAVLTAVTSTLATILGTYVSDKVTGKKTKSRTSATGRVVKNATSAATRSITKELTRDILGNLVK